MSIPACSRPQRQPNGLVTGPFTGQISPAADGVVSLWLCEPASCDRMLASAAASAFASAMKSFSCCFVVASA